MKSRAIPDGDEGVLRRRGRRQVVPQAGTDHRRSGPASGSSGRWTSASSSQCENTTAIVSTARRRPDRPDRERDHCSTAAPASTDHVTPASRPCEYGNTNAGWCVAAKSGGISTDSPADEDEQPQHDVEQQRGPGEYADVYRGSTRPAGERHADVAGEHGGYPGGAVRRAPRQAPGDRPDAASSGSLSGAPGCLGRRRRSAHPATPRRRPIRVGASRGACLLRPCSRPAGSAGAAPWKKPHLNVMREDADLRERRVVDAGGRIAVVHQLAHVGAAASTRPNQVRASAPRSARRRREPLPAASADRARARQQRRHGALGRTRACGPDSASQGEPSTLVPFRQRQVRIPFEVRVVRAASTSTPRRAPTRPCSARARAARAGACRSRWRAGARVRARSGPTPTARCHSGRRSSAGRCSGGFRCRLVRHPRAVDAQVALAGDLHRLRRRPEIDREAARPGPSCGRSSSSSA